MLVTKTKSTIFALLISLLACLQVNAVPQITATVDQTTIGINDVVTLNVVVSEVDVDRLNFPGESNDYRVIAQSSSSNFSYINGKSSSNQTFKFVIKPKHPGRITLPAASVNSGANVYTATPILITVSNKVAQAKPSPRPSPRNSAPRARTRTTHPRADEKVFSRISVDKPNPYLNEQVLLSLKVYHRGNLRSLDIPPFKLDNFISEKDNRAKEYREMYDGREYLVYEINLILFPIKAGQTTIPSSEIKGLVISDRDSRSFANFDPFRFMNPFLVEKPISISTDPLYINVKTLPRGAPKEFSGYVGDLVVNHDISSDSIKSGDAITLKTRVYGNGNFNNLDLNLVRDSKQYSIFKDQENLSEEINNSTKYFEATSKTVIIPNKSSGKVAMNVKPLVNFNPTTQRYESHGAQKYKISVIPNPNADIESQIKKYSQKDTQVSKAAPREILSIQQEQILSYKPQAISNDILILLIIIINIIALLAKSYQSLSKHNPFKPKQEAINYNQTLNFIRKADSVAEISKIVKDFRNKIKNKTNAQPVTLEEKFNKFLEETDRSNYGQQIDTDTSSDKQLEYFRLSAISLLQELNKTKEDKHKHAA